MNEVLLIFIVIPNMLYNLLLYILSFFAITLDSPFEDTAYAIDISHYQTVTNWDAEMAYKLFGTRQLKGMFMKATEGGTYVDDKYYSFSENVSKYPQIKVKGAYHFYRTNVNSGVQANHFADVLDKDPYFDKSKHFFVIDVEENKAGYSGSTFAGALQNFLDTMKSRGYKKPMIYSGKYFWDDNIGTAGKSLWTQAKLWMPRYGADDGNIPPGDKWYTEIPVGSDHVSVWQFTSKGKVDGISSSGLDLDLLNKELL